MASQLLRLSTGFRQGARKFSGLAGKELEAAIEEEGKHAKATAATWKKISFFVAIPGMLLCAYQAYTAEVEHMSHGRPEFVPLDHMRIRKKPFPWGDGDHSLFHSHNNPLPDGYEH